MSEQILLIVAEGLGVLELFSMYIGIFCSATAKKQKITLNWAD